MKDYDSYGNDFNKAIVTSQPNNEVFRLSEKQSRRADKTTVSPRDMANITVGSKIRMSLGADAATTSLTFGGVGTRKDTRFNLDS